MSFVSVQCLCCGGTAGELIQSRLTSVYTQRPYDVVRCTECGNGITLPVPSAEDLDKIYSTTYLYPVHLLALGEKKYRSKKTAAFVRSIVPVNANKKILEVGCMFGYLLQELKPAYRVKGIEISDEAVKYCKANGLEVDKLSVESFIENTKEQFDTIILSHVMEHLRRPDDCLERLKKLLLPGGKIILLVPNYLSVTNKLFGRFWGWWQVPVHVHHFNKSALSALADTTGYRISKSHFRGGDSLMLLLNLINLLGVKNDNKPPGFFSRLIIRCFTTFLRYWYNFGNEEITLVLELKNNA